MKAKENKRGGALLLRALIKLFCGIFLVSAMLFLPSWTLRYPAAWRFMLLLFVPILILGLLLYFFAPDLLEKRLNAKEKLASQKGAIGLSSLMFPALFVLSALDFRFAWSRVSSVVVVIASILFLAGYALFAVVLFQNRYLARTVEIQEGQKVIEDGLYGVVRHPMYLATLLLFFSIPLILGSYYGLIPLAVYPVILVVRIIEEEKLLSRELMGYKEYKDKVKYRLIPFIW